MLLNFGSSAPIDVVISGNDFEIANKLALQVNDAVKSTQGTTDVQISRELNLPELRIMINREKAGSMGVNVQQISNTIATAISGNVASIYTDPVTGNQYNMLVRLSEDYRDKIQDINNLTVINSQGQLVNLGNMITVEMAKAPIQIDRKYQERIVEITGNNSGRDLGSISKEIASKISYIKVPQGFPNYEWQYRTTEQNI